VSSVDLACTKAVPVAWSTVSTGSRWVGWSRRRPDGVITRFSSIRGARWTFWRSPSAVIAPVYDGRDEPHHGNEDERHPHRVDFVKQHAIAAFSLAS
jgi:hypothetical protein